MDGKLCTLDALDTFRIQQQKKQDCPGNFSFIIILIIDSYCAIRFIDFGLHCRHDVHCLRLPIFVCFDSEFNTLVFVKRTESFDLDASLMDEYITRVVVWHDEPVSFCRVEPIYEECRQLYSRNQWISGSTEKHRKISSSVAHRRRTHHLTVPVLRSSAMKRGVD